MARVGLLIEVNNCETGFTRPEPEGQQKTEALKQVLQHPERGKFAEVNILQNPDPLALQEAIEALAVGRSKDDLLLLYFCGQAFQDERSKLYLSTCLTRINTQGKLVKSTAIPANFIDDVLRDCPSKRQVIILDCCWLPNNSCLDVGQQLGGQGRVVLTAFTSPQNPLEEGAQFSTYTDYLVKGLRTGAADLNHDSVISISELYEYTRRKLQRVAPAISVKIYRSPGDKNRFVLAKAPIDDSKQFYRDEVERFPRTGKLSRVQGHHKSPSSHDAENQPKKSHQALDLPGANLLPVEAHTAQLKSAPIPTQRVKQHEGGVTSPDGGASKLVRRQRSALLAPLDVSKTTSPAPTETVIDTNNTRSNPVSAPRKSWLLVGAFVVTVLALAGIAYGLRWRQAHQLQTTETFAEQKDEQCMIPAISQEAPNSTSGQRRQEQCAAIDWQDVQVQTLSGHADTVWSVAISPDGQTLASGSGDQTIKLWNLQTGSLLRTFSGHADTVWSVAYAPSAGYANSPDGQTLASGSSDQTIKLWNLQTGELLQTLSGHTGPVRSIAISSDGQTLASGSSDQTIKLWNLQTGELLRTLSGHEGRVISVAISSDGQTLVSGSVDRTTKIWHLRNGELLHTLSGDPNWFNAAAIAPVSPGAPSSAGSLAEPDQRSYPKILATGSGDIKLWNLYTGELLHTLSQHSKDLTSVSFSLDGKILASGSQDRTIKIWQ